MKDSDADVYYGNNYDLIFDYIQKEKIGGYEIVNAQTSRPISSKPLYFMDSVKKCR